jgi:hypothetical protein
MLGEIVETRSNKRIKERSTDRIILRKYPEGNMPKSKAASTSKS